jgi:hypothetical protein
MKFIKSTLPILLLCFLPFWLFAQWYKLPAPNIPYKFGMLCNSLYVPYGNIYPAANGEIIYDIYCYLSPSSGGNYNIMESSDDLGIDTSKYSDNGMGCCSGTGMYSVNDSTHVFIENKAGWIFSYYTTNNFSSLKAFNAFIVPYGGPSVVTKNYIYVASQSWFEYNDSLYISRTTISSNTYKYKSFYSDSGTGKLYFVNDSTGFILTYHRNSHAPNFLGKTNDYGTTWNTVFSSPTYNSKDYCFPMKDTGYLILNDSVYKTVNGGITWNKLTVPGGSYTCIQFANGLIGYIGGSGGYLIKTINGGATWTSETSSTTNTISSLYTFGTSVAYFVDSTMKIYKNQPGLGAPVIQSPTSKLDIYPNPSNGEFTLEISSDLLKSQVTLYDVMGRLIYQTALAQTQSAINIPTLAKGIYYVKLVSPSGQFLQKKIVKE